METHSRLVRQRRDEIIDLLAETGRTKVSELARRYGVSSLTVRRDLSALTDEGLVRRTHGWVELIDPLGSSISSSAITAKRSIAAQTALLVDDGDTVFINTSSTALLVLEHIKAENVTVVTNNGKVLQLDLPPNLSVILTGGDIRLPKWSMAGEFALASIRRINAAKAILGCSGVSAKRGLTTLISHETSVNSLMMEQSDMRILVADSTKVGVSSSFRYGSPEQVDILVTDKSADEGELTRLKRAGVRRILRPDEPPQGGRAPRTAKGARRKDP